MGLLGSIMNELRFNYNKLHNWDILLVLDSLGFIADGIHNLDNWCPILPFDYVGRGIADNEYVEGVYNFSNWRLDCSSLCCKYFKSNVL